MRGPVEILRAGVRRPAWDDDGLDLRERVLDGREVLVLRGRLALVLRADELEDNVHVLRDLDAQQVEELLHDDLVRGLRDPLLDEKLRELCDLRLVELVFEQLKKPDELLLRHDRPEVEELEDVRVLRPLVLLLEQVQLEDHLPLRRLLQLEVRVVAHHVDLPQCLLELGDDHEPLEVLAHRREQVLHLRVLELILLDEVQQLLELVEAELIVEVLVVDSE